jgi:hypothetical protein
MAVAAESEWAVTVGPAASRRREVKKFHVKWLGRGEGIGWRGWRRRLHASEHDLGELVANADTWFWF